MWKGIANMVFYVKPKGFQLFVQLYVVYVHRIVVKFMALIAQDAYERNYWCMVIYLDILSSKGISFYQFTAK